MNAIQQLLTEHMAIWTAADTEKKSGRGRASGNAGTVYGIKKLRELILELAVRGKLVPQDANDEPASELLKRIQAEKVKFLAEGKVKKDKPLAPITVDEKPFELPLGWEWVSLNEVADVIRGVTYGKSDASDDPLNDYVPLLRGNNIDCVLNFDKPVYVPSKLLNESQFVKKGDIVIAMSSGSADLVGKAAQAEIDFNGGFGAFCGVVRSFSSELLSYFSYFFQTPYYRKTVAGYGKGIGINNLQKSSLVLLNLPIPPLAEQLRIAAKIDELMALCDQLEAQHSNAAEAHEKLVNHLLVTLTQSQSADDFSANWQRIAVHFDTLFTTEVSIDALKQTLLQLAVMGKLVPQDANDEPASELLKRIQAEKAKLIGEGKLKKEKAFALISEEEKPFQLPKDWEWVRIEFLNPDFQNGVSSRGDVDGEPIVVLRLADINERRISLDDPRELTISSGMIEKYRLNAGDILIVRVNGSADLVGGFVLSESVINAIYCDHFIRMRISQNVLNPRFLNLVGASSLIRDRIKDLFITTAGQKTVNQTHISSLVIPLLPLAEQHRIVAKVDELMGLCDKLKNRIQQANQQQQAIANALVAQAVA